MEATSALKPESVSKRKQSKSRNGCITCKAKRLKCDETKPTCQQCAKRNVSCGGYKKDFKWRPFEEANFAPRQYASRPKKVDSPPVRPQPQTKKSPSPSSSDARSTRSTSFNNELPTADPAIDLPFPNVEAFVASASSDAEIPPAYPGVAQATGTPPDFPDAIDQAEPRNLTQMTWGETLAVLPQASAGHLISSTHHDLSELDHAAPTRKTSISRGKAPAFAAPDLGPGAIGPPTLHETREDDVEEIVRYDLYGQFVAEPSVSSPSGSSSVTSDKFLNFVVEPRFSRDSPEMIALRFDRMTCGILSVKDGPTENPWRTMIWPLAHSSPALYHALASMTAFHSCALEKKYRYQGVEHMRLSLGNLAANIGNVPLETAIATTLSLAFAESWDTHITSGVKHLRGAKVLIDSALAHHQAAPMDPSSTSYQQLRFLCSTWMYQNVIAGLTTEDAVSPPTATAQPSRFETTGFFPFYGPTIPSADAMDPEYATPSGPSSPLFTYPDVSLDPLMGCAATLFPLLERVGALARQIRSAPALPFGRYSNSPRIISTAVELRAALKRWVPPAFFESPEDPTSRIQHSLQTAEAYRFATLLHLHRAVPEVPSPPASALATKVLELLATVPMTSRAVIVQMFPLMAAGSEMDDPEDREWVVARWQALWSRMRLGMLERCLELCKEVWARRDAFEARREGDKPQTTERNPSSARTEWPVGVSRGVSEFDASTGIGEPIPTMTREQEIMPGSEGVERKLDSGAWDFIHGLSDPEYSVRGSLHWLSVMKEWDWELFLG